MAFSTIPVAPMAKERNPATATVKIDPELLRKANQIVAFLPPDEDGKPVKLADYLDQLLRASIERDHAKLLKRMAKEGTDPDD